jgi:hypothetical protein
MSFKLDPFTGKLAYAPANNLSTVSVNNLDSVSQNGAEAYCPDATGFGKLGTNSQGIVYSKNGTWYRTDNNTEVTPNVVSIWDVGSKYNNYNPATGGFNETIISSTTLNGVLTQNSLIDMPINGYLIRVYVKYQVKTSLRGQGNLPCFIYTNGWGSTVGDFTNYANLGYAVIQYDWRGTFNGTYSYPSTLMTLYPAALNRLNQVTNPNANYTSQASVASISDVRNQDMYYWYAIPRRVLAYTKSLTADIDPNKIGFYGNSWGGQIAYSMAIDPSIKAIVAQFGNGWIHWWKTFSVFEYATPYVEPTFSDGNNYYISTLESQAYANAARVPLLWLSSTNDFHGQFDRSFYSYDISPVKGSYAFKANSSHDVTGFEQDVQLWFDKHLKGQAITWPSNPDTIPSLVASGANAGYPMVTVSPSNPSDVSSVQIYYALETVDPQNRTWIAATTVNNGNGTWSAQTPCNNVNGYVFAYAQITYTSTIIVCSRQAAFIPSSLGSAVPLPVNYWSPTNASATMNLWLDAADSNTLTISSGLVTQWRDKSSIANHAIPNSGEEPAFTTLNGLNAIRFTGSKRLFSTDKFTSRDFRNVFIVCKYEQGTAFYSASTGFCALFSAALSGGTSNGNAFFATGVTQAWTANSFLGGPFFLNATQVSADTTNRTVLPQLNTSLGFISANAASAVSVGGYGIGTLREITSPWDGVVCEIVSYGSTLSTTDRQKMEGYLAWKWNLVGLLPSGHPYKNSRPTV